MFPFLSFFLSNDVCLIALAMPAVTPRSDSSDVTNEAKNYKAKASAWCGQKGHACEYTIGELSVPQLDRTGFDAYVAIIVALVIGIAAYFIYKHKKKKQDQEGGSGETEKQKTERIEAEGVAKHKDKFNAKFIKFFTGQDD